MNTYDEKLVFSRINRVTSIQVKSLYEIIASTFAEFHISKSERTLAYLYQSTFRDTATYNSLAKEFVLSADPAELEKAASGAAWEEFIFTMVLCTSLMQLVKEDAELTQSTTSVSNKVLRKQRLAGVKKNAAKHKNIR